MIRNPIRELDRIVNSRQDEQRRINNLRPSAAYQPIRRSDSRSDARGESSSKDKLHQLLNQPLPRNNLDAYISIEQNQERNHESRAGSKRNDHSNSQLYPEYKKNESSRLRIQSENPRIMSSKRENSPLREVGSKKELSVQPRLNNNPSRYHLRSRDIVPNSRQNHSYESRSSCN